MSDKEPTKWFSGKKTYCLITGASRGLGRELALQFSAQMGRDSILLLLARDASSLEATREQVLGVCPGARVALVTYDLSEPDPDRFTDAISESLLGYHAASQDFKQAVIVHNAGSVGRPMEATQCGDPTEWAEYLATNVTSAVSLNTAFLRIFALNKEKLVISVSSICALKPFPGLSLYCTGKAARDMYFSTLAAENPDVTVINYAPGPLDTRMFHEIISYTQDELPSTAEIMQKIIDDGRLLTCEMTTKKLLTILQAGDFVSGSHVDYYDK